jgi:hypothetical protein
MVFLVLWRRNLFLKPSYVVCSWSDDDNRLEVRKRFPGDLVQPLKEKYFVLKNGTLCIYRANNSCLMSSGENSNKEGNASTVSASRRRTFIP